MRRRTRGWIVAIALDVEVSSLTKGTTVAVRPFQSLRGLQAGQPLRVQAGT